jgi:hypothetical protein
MTLPQGGIINIGSRFRLYSNEGSNEAWIGIGSSNNKLKIGDADFGTPWVTFNHGGTATFAGAITSSHSTTTAAAATISNTHSGGYGLYVAGGSGTNRAFNVRDYNSANDLFYVQGNGNTTINGERTQFGESAFKYHVLNGSKSSVASGTWTSMAWVNHSHCVQVYVFAYSAGAVTRSAIFDVQTHYGSNGTNTRRIHHGYGKISAIDLQYNNNGYKLDFRVTTDDASTTTVYWSVVGMSSDQMYNL